eukprot:scaffold23864_cov96-Isochrysis_galbana.AAC.1
MPVVARGAAPAAQWRVGDMLSVGGRCDPCACVVWIFPGCLGGEDGRACFAVDYMDGVTRYEEVSAIAAARESFYVVEHFSSHCHATRAQPPPPRPSDPNGPPPPPL